MAYLFRSWSASSRHGAGAHSAWRRVSSPAASGRHLRENRAVSPCWMIVTGARLDMTRLVITRLAISRLGMRENTPTEPGDVLTGALQQQTAPAFDLKVP